MVLGTQIGDQTRLQDTNASDAPSLGFHAVVTPPVDGAQYVHRTDAGVHTEASGQPMIYQALINSDGTENTAAVRVYLRLADLDSLSEAEATRASIEWYRISYCPTRIAT